MNNGPLVSVIIPFYKVERYLKESIESVLEQTYTRWEMLLVDDGSPDGSTAIALEYVNQYPDKIRYLHHPGKVNKGLPATRNLGIENAKGDWLALLDADDVWLPEKMEHQVSVALKFPQLAMICEASEYWSSWFDSNKRDVIVPVGAPQDVVIPPPQAAVALYPLGKGAAPCPCSVMIRKDKALLYGAFEEQFKGKYALYEDQAFFIKIYLHESIYVSSKALDRYRQRGDSIMSTADADNNYHEVRYFYLNWLQQYIKEQKINSSAVRKKLKVALYRYKHPLLFRIEQGIKKRLSKFKG